MSAAYVLAQAVCSPPLARLVDQHGQARVMRPAIAVSASGLVTLVLAAAAGAPVWTLYVAAVVVGSTIGSFGALVRARWSHVLDDPRTLHTAYSLESALDELVFVVGPILATILTVAASRETALQGVVLLTIYSAGLAVPFLLAGWSIERFFQAFARIRMHFRKLEIVSGLMLVGVGFLLVTDRLSSLNSRFRFLTDALGAAERALQ